MPVRPQRPIPSTTGSYQIGASPPYPTKTTRGVSTPLVISWGDLCPSSLCENSGARGILPSPLAESAAGRNCCSEAAFDPRWPDANELNRATSDCGDPIYSAQSRAPLVVLTQPPSRPLAGPLLISPAQDREQGDGKQNVQPASTHRLRDLLSPLHLHPPWVELRFVCGYDTSTSLK